MRSGRAAKCPAPPPRGILQTTQCCHKVCYGGWPLGLFWRRAKVFPTYLCARCACGGVNFSHSHLLVMYNPTNDKRVMPRGRQEDAPLSSNNPLRSSSKMWSQISKVIYNKRDKKVKVVVLILSRFMDGSRVFYGGFYTRSKRVEKLKGTPHLKCTSNAHMHATTNPSFIIPPYPNLSLYAAPDAHNGLFPIARSIRFLQWVDLPPSGIARFEEVLIVTTFIFTVLSKIIAIVVGICLLTRILIWGLVIIASHRIVSPKHVLVRTRTPPCRCRRWPTCRGGVLT